MAIGDDFSINAAGDIRHVSGSTTYDLMEVYRWLQDLSDDESAGGNDFLDSLTQIDVAKRSFDTIITLNGTYNIDDTAAQFIYGGSIAQDSGNTLYSGLKVKGSVNSGATEIQVIQNNGVVTSFWGTGLNADAAELVLLRVLVKTRVGGFDIDAKKVSVQVREWGDTYTTVPITLGVGEETAGVETLSDGQNDSVKATVEAYTHVTNTEGFQLIDIQNGNGNQEYYSKWTYGADTSGDGLKGVYEWSKAVQVRGSAKTVHGINGELFQGITHSFAYDTESGGPFVEDEILAWGTTFNYDNELSGPFVVGDRLDFGTSGAKGVLLHLVDAGATGTMVVAIESGVVVDNDPISTQDGAQTADINGTPTDTAATGGTGLLLALDDDGATGNIYMQTLTGSAPVDNLPVKGRTSDALMLVNGTVTARTVSKVFIGVYTGSLAGAYGIGILDTNLVAADTLIDLTGTEQAPPNNQSISITGVDATDRLTLLRDDGAGDMLTAEYTLAAGNNSGNGTLVIAEAINAYTPATGQVRVQDPTNPTVFDRYTYTSWTGSTFTLTGTLSQTYTATDDANVPIIDQVAGATSVSKTAKYTVDIDVVGWVRNGGVTPIVPFPISGTFGAGGFTVKAVRTPDA